MSHEPTAGAVVRPDVELAFRITTLQAARALPDQTPEQLADLDEKIAALKAEQARGAFTFDDLFAQVQALELAYLSMSVTIDTLCQALACAYGENHAGGLRQVALDVIASPPESGCLDPRAVDHGRTVAVAVLTDMADAIDRGRAVVEKTVAGPKGVQ